MSTTANRAARIEVYAKVLTAMQESEELGGPEGAEYVALMFDIANSAIQRLKTVADSPEQFKIWMDALND